MHVHIEGIMTLKLRWALAHRYGIPILNYKAGEACQSLVELNGLYQLLDDLEEGGIDGGMPRFFEPYYSDFEVLWDKDDFYRLAISYFQSVALMNVRYCELFLILKATRDGTCLSRRCLARFRRA